jgi:hypothetical protein
MRVPGVERVDKFKQHKHDMMGISEGLLEKISYLACPRSPAYTRPLQGVDGADYAEGQITH